MREALVESISFTVEESCKILTLMHSKNQIADSLIKNIDKNFKTQTATLPNNSGINKKQESSTNTIKVGRKPFSQNIPVPNQKNFSKKNVRKDYSASNIPPSSNNRSGSMKAPQTMK